MPDNKHPDYGLDAPAVVRNLLVAAAAFFLLWGTAVAGFWSGIFSFELFHAVRIYFPLGSIGWVPGLGFLSMGCWMLWSSKIGKVHGRERLLRQIVWRGNEQVLDVGCGRGLMLIGAAKYLTTGKAVGIDTWQAEDLSGNNAEATLENAKREGVAERVEVLTADMRDLPFPNEAFDVVVSKAAIHNIYSADDRAVAIREIARVLKPHGVALISDIRHLCEYVVVFEKHGCTLVRQLDSPIQSVLLMLITFGSLHPGTVLLKKVTASHPLDK